MPHLPGNRRFVGLLCVSSGGPLYPQCPAWAGAKKTYQRLFYRYRELVAGVLGFVQQSLHHCLQLGELQPSFREFGYAN